MARISQDASSWRASGIIRRDFRHTHDGPEVITRSSSSGKKGHARTSGRGNKAHKHEHSFCDTIVNADLQVSRYCFVGEASYTPAHIVRICSICGPGSRRAIIIEHIVTEGTYGLRTCSCGEQWHHRPGISPKCPSDYNDQYRRRSGGRWGSRELRSSRVSLRGGPRPSALRVSDYSIQSRVDWITPTPKWLQGWWSK